MGSVRTKKGTEPNLEVEGRFSEKVASKLRPQGIVGFKQAQLHVEKGRNNSQIKKHLEYSRNFRISCGRRIC